MTWWRDHVERRGEEGHSAASTRQLSLASPTGSGKNSGHLRTLNFVSVCRLQGYRKSMKRCQMCQKKRAVCPSQGQIPLRRGSGRESWTMKWVVTASQINKSNLNLYCRNSWPLVLVLFLARRSRAVIMMTIHRWRHCHITVHRRSPAPYIW